MTSFLNLQTYVSRDLADPDKQTFDADAVKDFIQQGLAAIARIAPAQFIEDLTPVTNQTSYPLRQAIFGALTPEIRVVRVEVWSGTPSVFRYKIRSKAGQTTRDSIAGWEVWNGSLEIPYWNAYANILNPVTDIIRVWGYSPYGPISADADVVPVSAELELAIRTFCRVEGMRRLIGSRVLFKQWQTRSNNSDVTLGQLNSDLQIADEEWRRLSRALKVPEQNPD